MEYLGKIEDLENVQTIIAYSAKIIMIWRRQRRKEENGDDGKGEECIMYLLWID